MKKPNGSRFGRLVLTGEKRQEKVTRTIWKYKLICDCGNVRWVTSCSVGKNQSCGCAKNEAFAKARRSHGMSKTRTFRIWSNMLTRCFNPKGSRYPGYGGRGITVCEDWKHSFEAFFADMGECPPDHQLDRIDNDGNYDPENCRWTDRKTNCRNRSSNRHMTHLGETATVEEWAERLGLPARSLRSRLAIGWSDEKALTTPFLGVVGANKARRQAPS